MLGFVHLRERTRLSQGLEPFPARDSWKRLLDYLMYGVGILAPFALAPQILQIYTTKDTTGLSLTTWFLFVCMNIFWTLYGTVHKDSHILFANILMMLANLIVVVGILMYSNVL